MSEARAGVAVIGAGVIGASAAFHLREIGLRDIVVLERAPAIGRGSTGRATGGFRELFGTEIDIELSRISRRALESLARDAPGVALAPVGYLFLARSESGLAALADAARFATDRQVGDVRVLSREDVLRVNPAVAVEDLAGGVFSARDGYIRPLAILEAYLDAARAGGVAVRTDAGFVVPEIEGGRVVGVRRHTPGGSERVLATERVVVAGGAWSGEIGRAAGVEIPVVPERRQVAITEPFDRLPPDMPMTIDVEDGFHLRVRDGRVLLLYPTPTRGAHPEDPFDTSFDASWLEDVLPRARARVPVLAEARIDREACWAGLYENTPDGHLLLGEHPDVRGLYLATGGSGHGVMHAPAAGRLVAEIVAHGEATTLDVRALRVSRFREGDAIGGAALL